MGAVLALSVAGLAIGQALLQNKAEAQRDTVQAPMFEVDPLWPKPLPNHWLLGWTIGLWVDEQDHVWVVHRGAGGLHNNERGLELNPPISECCRTALYVLVFDPAGNLVGSWGGPGAGYEWPGSNHGIVIDHKGNVWIGGNGPKDSHILKFTKDGKFLQQFGNMGKNAGSNSPDQFGRVAKIWIDPKANEAYVADGYLNKRVAVLDVDTGKMKRYWGAYGNKPNDDRQPAYSPSAPPSRQFANPVHCATLSRDGKVYVCDRTNNRIQTFKFDGTYLNQYILEPNTKGDGAPWEIAFSKDAKQQFMYVSDGSNEKIHVFDRASVKELYSFGGGGRTPGLFYAVHSIITDSKGNIYTTETYEGKRLQKFVYKGMGQVVAGSQGVVWPKR